VLCSIYLNFNFAFGTAKVLDSASSLDGSRTAFRKHLRKRFWSLAVLIALLLDLVIKLPWRLIFVGEMGMNQYVRGCLSYGDQSILLTQRSTGRSSAGWLKLSMSFVQVWVLFVCTAYNSLTHADRLAHQYERSRGLLALIFILSPTFHLNSCFILFSTEVVKQR
jgi:hypothetical protein